MASLLRQQEVYSLPPTTSPSEPTDTPSFDAEGFKNQICHLLEAANQVLHPKVYLSLLDNIRNKIDLELEERFLSEENVKTHINESKPLPPFVIFVDLTTRKTPEPTMTPESLISSLNPFKGSSAMGDLDEVCESVQKKQS